MSERFNANLSLSSPEVIEKKILKIFFLYKHMQKHFPPIVALPNPGDINLTNFILNHARKLECKF
jgi:hypothetical protein